MKLKFLIIAYSAFFCLGAQDAKTDLQAINKAMGVESYSAKLNYKSYLDGQLTENLASEIKVNKTKYKLTIGNIVKINNGKINLTIDKLNGILALSANEVPGLMLKNLPPLDSFLSRAISTSYTKTEDQGTYIFSLKGYKEKRVEISFDLKSFELKRIYVVLADGIEDNEGKDHEQAIEIIYKTFIKNSDIPASTFSTEKYVRKQGKKYIPVGEYKSYKIIDLLYNKQ